MILQFFPFIERVKSLSFIRACQHIMRCSSMTTFLAWFIDWSSKLFTEHFSQIIFKVVNEWPSHNMFTYSTHVPVQSSFWYRFQVEKKLLRLLYVQSWSLLIPQLLPTTDQSIKAAHNVYINLGMEESFKFRFHDDVWNVFMLSLQFGRYYWLYLYHYVRVRYLLSRCHCCLPLHLNLLPYS